MSRPDPRTPPPPAAQIAASNFDDNPARRADDAERDGHTLLRWLAAAALAIFTLAVASLVSCSGGSTAPDR